MMNMLEEAIIYATIMQQGKRRTLGGNPKILHSLEVAQILATLTDDQEVISAGILHDLIGSTDATIEEIERRFGKRVAVLVDSKAGKQYEGLSPGESWKRRKKESLKIMKNSRDIGMKMLWLADMLSTLRTFAGLYSERGEEFWKGLSQSDSAVHCWYCKSVAELLELSLNKTGAFKELIVHINSIWPGTFPSDKARYRKYKEVSIEGCERIGKGAKGDVYRYDDELIIKVFNEKNTYHDVENEIALSRRAFILGIPTAISFGIVSVGDRYGAMYELVNAHNISSHLAKHPYRVDYYAKAMAELAHVIHSIRVSDDDLFPEASKRLMRYIDGGIALEDEELAVRCRALLNALPVSRTLIHGDFHTGNVFIQKGDPILIDMDRLSTGHPIIELSDIYYFYVILGEDDPSIVEDFMGFSYETAKIFFSLFMEDYLGTKDEKRVREVAEKASLLGCTRNIRRLKKTADGGEKNREIIDRYVNRIRVLTDRLDTLTF